MAHVCRKASVQILLDMENVFLLLILQPLRKSPFYWVPSRGLALLFPLALLCSVNYELHPFPLCFFSPFSFISANDQDKDKREKKRRSLLYCLPSDSHYSLLF